jgi:D-aminopeptidase
MFAHFDKNLAEKFYTSIRYNTSKAYILVVLPGVKHQDACTLLFKHRSFSEQHESSSISITDY